MKKLIKWFNWVRVKLGFRRSWVDVGNNLRRRKYKNYPDYKAHQRSKAPLSDLTARNLMLRTDIPKRVADLPFWNKDATVLCLAARGGGEVQAFLDLGCFAVGIDLEPGKENPYVLHGDFHDIQFPNGSVDIVYTNSLDHVFAMKKVISEIKRVLKPDGHLILEIMRGSAEGKEPQFWEASWWKELGDVVKLFIEQGFVKLSQRPYAKQKEQICFRKGAVKDNEE